MGSDRRRPRADVTETVLGVDEVPARRPGDRDHLTLVGLIGEHAQPLVPIDGSPADLRKSDANVGLNDLLGGEANVERLQSFQLQR